MAYDYVSSSRAIQTRLMAMGLMPHHLVMIGAFVTAYGLFETTLERALWSLSGVPMEGKRPFTETMNASQQFEMLGAGSPKLSDDCNAVLAVAACAARDLHEYRNSLVHGYLVSLGPGTVPSFMKNPHWFGASGRRKAHGDAFIDEPYQDLVLVAAWNLFGVVRTVERAFKDPDAEQVIIGMKADVDRAKSYAGETRHRAALANHEKS
ncbi:hypothetical protein [Stenotrophomonas sp. S41]|uniref:hypothetical protein n=1 Tax=Stenotrophomonas sp. S41 TaxID=2767464 RepID=UPI00190A0680|nr:hypothetical protein [Stenotrophomonas sp. S41]MBK0010815.1 hypothetical protein [Stenotrophomonas sp. S41]